MNGTKKSIRAFEGQWNELSADVDYTEQGSMKYIGHLQGHGHRDGVLASYGVKALNIYNVNSCFEKVSLSQDYINAGFEVYDRLRNDHTEQALDIVSVDTKKDTITMTRVGAGGDRIIHYVPMMKNVGDSFSVSTQLKGNIVWNAYGNSATVSNGVVNCTKHENTMCIIRAENEKYDKEYWCVYVS